MKAGYVAADRKMEAGFERVDKKFDRSMWGLVAVGRGAVPALLDSSPP